MGQIFHEIDELAAERAPEVTGIVKRDQDPADVANGARVAVEVVLRALANRHGIKIPDNFRGSLLEEFDQAIAEERAAHKINRDERVRMEADGV